VIANTADDITLHGLRICPDLDTIMYTLGGGADRVRGWGRHDESWQVMEEFAAYGVEPTWFSLGDRDIGTHLVRTQMLNAGYPLSEVTAALCTRWLAHDEQLRLLPMTDDRVETHVTIADPEAPGSRRAMPVPMRWPSPSSASTRRGPHPALSRPSRTLI
jgi:LPPG:FO 2-phospho-L-lactate transferase